MFKLCFVMNSCEWDLKPFQNYLNLSLEDGCLVYLSFFVSFGLEGGWSYVSSCSIVHCEATG